jgi:hypothetical protein
MSASPDETDVGPDVSAPLVVFVGVLVDVGATVSVTPTVGVLLYVASPLDGVPTSLAGPVGAPKR